MEFDADILGSSTRNDVQVVSTQVFSCEPTMRDYKLDPQKRHDWVVLQWIRPTGKLLRNLHHIEWEITNQVKNMIRTGLEIRDTGFENGDPVVVETRRLHSKCGSGWTAWFSGRRREAEVRPVVSDSLYPVFEYHHGWGPSDESTQHPESAE